MGETKHTPGPWIDGGTMEFSRHRLISSVNGAQIACVYGPRAGAGAGEQQANASLIAAAPETAAERDRLRDVNAELVAALRRVRGSFEDANGKVFLGWRDEADAVDAAIAKAEGQL